VIAAGAAQQVLEARIEAGHRADAPGVEPVAVDVAGHRGDACQRAVLRVRAQPGAGGEHEGHAAVAGRRLVGAPQRVGVVAGGADRLGRLRCASQPARVALRHLLALHDARGDGVLVDAAAALHLAGEQRVGDRAVHAHRAQRERFGAHAHHVLHVDLRGVVPAHDQPEVVAAGRDAQRPEHQAGQARVGDAPARAACRS